MASWPVHARDSTNRWIPCATIKSARILVVASFLARGAVSACELAGPLAGSICEWQGSAPACGEAEAGLELGKATAKGEQLVAWTRDHSWSDLFDPKPGELSDHRFRLHEAMLPCGQQYGVGCLRGYKRLVCKGAKIPQETIAVIDSPAAPCAPDDDVCVKHHLPPPWFHGVLEGREHADPLTPK